MKKRTSISPSPTSSSSFPSIGRISPLSQGISTRTLPRASLEEIKKTLDHYEKKSSIKEYHDHVASARFLKELIRDIRALLVPLESMAYYSKEDVDQKIKINTNRIVSEYIDAFGPDSEYLNKDDPASILKVSPLSLRKRLDAQSEEIQSLRKQNEDIQKRAALELRRLMDQVNTFAARARASVRQENSLRSVGRGGAKDTIKLLRLAHEKEIRHLRSEYELKSKRDQGPAFPPRHHRTNGQRHSPSLTPLATTTTTSMLPSWILVEEALLDKAAARTDAEEAAYLHRRKKEVQELRDTILAAMSTTQKIGGTLVSESLDPSLGAVQVDLRPTVTVGDRRRP